MKIAFLPHVRAKSDGAKIRFPVATQMTMAGPMNATLIVFPQLLTVITTPVIATPGEKQQENNRLQFLIFAASLFEAAPGNRILDLFFVSAQAVGRFYLKNLPFPLFVGFA